VAPPTTWSEIQRFWMVPDASFRKFPVSWQQRKIDNQSNLFIQISKISFPVWVVPGLKVKLISCAQLCANLDCFSWIEFEVSSRKKKETSYACMKLLETYSSWIEACNQSPDALSLVFLRVTSTSGIDDYDMTLRKLEDFHRICS
jgi:hypothetical protein